MGGPACTARQTVGTLAGVARASFSSATRDERRQGVEMRFEHGASTVTLNARRHLTRRCFNSRTHDPLTRYFAATSAAIQPAVNHAAPA